ncbi:hypothetical protein ACGFJ7_13430 [Actinoplanes sp. NPDC048988]|uniref:hypothetical protein n=1 Tax=Actinoplanes sp. NPDC048988 TaxID=3363901 RepID=UPI003723F1BD
MTTDYLVGDAGHAVFVDQSIEDSFRGVSGGNGLRWRSHADVQAAPTEGRPTMPTHESQRIAAYVSIKEAWLVRLFGRGIKRRSAQSWWGLPVPADLRVVSSDELTELISTAEKRGFSRTAKDLHPRGGETFAVLPYLYEGSPEASWMCLVIQVNDWNPPPGTRPEVTFGRLDIARTDFDSLRRARRWERDQLLHWTAWLASKRRPVPADGAETD